MKMEFSPLPAQGNFRLKGIRSLTNGLKIEVLLAYIAESSPDPREIDKLYCKRIKSMDLTARNSKNVEIREKAKENLRKMAMKCLNIKARHEVMRYSALLHTYPYLSNGAKNGAIEWVGESTIKSVEMMKEIKKRNREGLKRMR